MALIDKLNELATATNSLATRTGAEIKALAYSLYARTVRVVKPEFYDAQAGTVGYNSHAAFQAAIAESEANGWAVQLSPNKVYEIGAPLVLNATANKPAVIVGHRTTWVKARAGFTGNMIDQSAANGMVEDIALVDLNLDGALLANKCVHIRYAHRAHIEGGWWKNVTNTVGHFGGSHVYECVMRRTRLSGIQPQPGQTPAQMPAKSLVWDANDSWLSEIIASNSQELVTLSRGGNYVAGLHVFGYPYKTAIESRDFLATVGVRVSGESNTLVGTYIDNQHTGILVEGTDVIISETRNYVGADWTPTLASPMRVIDVMNNAGASGRISGVTTNQIPAGITVGGSACYLRGGITPKVDVSGIVPNQLGAGGAWASGGPGPLTALLSSRGSSLVSNGNAALGTNYNFSTLALVRSDHPTGTSGCFQSALSTALLTDETIGIDPAKWYDLAHAIKQHTGDGARRFYTFLAPIDADGLAITGGTYMEQAGTRTTLAAPLAVGATTVTLTSAANWNNAAGAATHLRTMVFWSYTDGQGYTWPAGTYSRILRSNAYADGGISGDVITLSAAWGGPALPAGTAVSNGSSGPAYMYGPQNLLAPSTWTDYGPYRYGGVHTDLTVAATTAFPIPTASVRVGFLLNQGVADPTALARVAKVSLLEVSAVNNVALQPGSTASRPAATAVRAGTMRFDTTLGRPCWSTGVVWKDAAGTTV